MPPLLSVTLNGVSQSTGNLKKSLSPLSALTSSISLCTWMNFNSVYTWTIIALWKANPLKDISFNQFHPSLTTRSEFSIPQAAAGKQTVTLSCVFLMLVHINTVSEPYPCSVMSRDRPTASGGARLLGVCELLTRISTDLSDVFFDMSEVTSHKAAVILAVEYGTPWIRRKKSWGRARPGQARQDWAGLKSSEKRKKTRDKNLLKERLMLHFTTVLCSYSAAWMKCLFNVCHSAFTPAISPAVQI